jgi:hypothetical protein
MVLYAAMLSGCASQGSDGVSAQPTIGVAGTSASAPSWGFSDPEPVDTATALTALTNAIALHPDDYGGVSVARGAAVTTATVHLVAGTKLTADVASFMAAASDAGVQVTTDIQKYSLSQLEQALAALPKSAAFSDRPGLLVSAELNVDSNTVRVTVSQLTPALTAAVKDEFGAAVSLVLPTG